MYHIVVNPASRSGKGYKLWQEKIEPILKSENILYKVHFSKKEGDIALIAATLLDQMESEVPIPDTIHIVLLGGDGTLNELIQGLAPSPLCPKVILGYIPTGSSNDFARDMKIPKDPVKALHLILHSGSAKPMDLGCLKYSDSSIRYFAVSSGIGYDAAVCEESTRSTMKTLFNKIGLGKLTYLGLALKQLIATKSVPCSIILDDETKLEFSKILFIASMIHRFEGGGFNFCPNASHDDGLLDICLIERMPKLLILIALPTAMFGKHYMFSGIHPYRCKKISIQTDSPLWVHTDGEVERSVTSIEVSCLYHALSIIY